MLLYEKVTQKVYELLASRKLKAHDPVPSEAELAELFGVSRMTTKLALEALQRKGLVYRIHRRGTFMAEGFGDIAVNLESINDEEPGNEKPNTVAIIVPELDDYTGSIVSAVSREAKNRGYSVLLKISDNLPDEDAILQQLKDIDKTSGIFLFPRGRKTCSDVLLRMILDKFPVVLIDRVFKEIEIDCVYHDHYCGMYNLTSYLIEKGHQNIGYVSLPFADVTSREERYQGYIQALIDHNIPIHTHYIYLSYYSILNFCPTTEQKELREFICSNKELTAAVCGDDYVASQLMYTCINAGISVPQQLSIVGFSDINFASLLPVPLTTVKQYTEELGGTAFRLLNDRMENNRGPALKIKLKTQIIERKSVVEKLLNMSLT